MFFVGAPNHFPDFFPTNQGHRLGSKAASPFQGPGARIFQGKYRLVKFSKCGQVLLMDEILHQLIGSLSHYV